MTWEYQGITGLSWDEYCKHHRQVQYPSDASFMSCGGADVPLEPLTDLMRNPAFPCEQKWPAALSLDYLWFKHTKPKPPGSKSFYFDMGCSLWGSGGGPGENELGRSHMAWVATTYMKQGVQWDRIVGWEAAKHTREQICEGVPADIAQKFTYFNEGVSDDRRSEQWAWKYLLKHTEPSDFVVVKLGIDSRIENSLAQQIFEDPAIHERIDVFFLEQHWSRGTKAMRLGCERDGATPSAFHHNQTWTDPIFWRDPVCIHPGGFHRGDVRATLTDLYRNITALRNMGILAHSWF